MDNPIHTSVDILDELELIAVEQLTKFPEKYEVVNCPINETFTDGLYSRKITMPAGKIVFSETHKFEHQFAILEGVCSVWTKESGWEILTAGHTGVTKAGTRRVLKIETETVWITFHPNPNNWKTEAEIHDEIIVKFVNPLLDGHYERNAFIPDNKELVNS